MNDDTDFGNAPVSIAELRSDRTGKAQDWMPRDALINALRDIDSGKLKPDKLFIAMVTHQEDANDKFNQFFAGGSTLELYGLIELAKLDWFASF